jgi:phosphomannomutase
MLSISGLRGLVGSSLTPAVATRFGSAFGSWLNDTLGRAGHVVLGRDSRASGRMIEPAVTAGLLATGCRVTRVGILSTPGVAVMIDELGADGGMVVTASHNPLPWNGLKPLRADGVAPPPDQARQIIRRFHEDDFNFVETPGEAHHESRGCDVHVQRVLKLVDIELIKQAKLRCVVDSVHGAGGAEARALLAALGVEVQHLYAEPTGDFPHTPEPTQANLVSLSEAAAGADAHVGFAQDPDADRLAIVDEAGRYLGEEYTLALCALHMLEAGASIAANLSTSRMIDDIARQRGATVVRTPVGEANVAAAMREHDATLGGEGNGGIIDRRISQVRDSIVGIAFVLEMLAARKQPLSAIVNDIPAYAMVKDKVSIEGLSADEAKDKVKARFADARLDTQDGVRVDLDQRWVHVRASNTEPILRLIAEAPTTEAAQDLINQCRAAIGLT